MEKGGGGTARVGMDDLKPTVNANTGLSSFTTAAILQNI